MGKITDNEQLLSMIRIDSRPPLTAFVIVKQRHDGATEDDPESWMEMTNFGEFMTTAEARAYYDDLPNTLRADCRPAARYGGGWTGARKRYTVFGRYLFEVEETKGTDVEFVHQSGSAVAK